MAYINLNNEHQTLIQSAIALGDWMKSLPELSAQDCVAIEAVQQALQQLPEIQDHTLAMYGVSLEQGDSTQGLIRGWDVSLEYFSDDPSQQGGLELFSSWLPVPESEDAAVLAEKKQHEVYFHWYIGDVCNFIQPDKAKRWQDEVSNPLALLQANERVRIEIVYQDYYSEVAIPT